MPDKPRLKIAYLCESDPALTWTHSGGNSRIFNTLQKHVGDVTFIDNRWGSLEWLRTLIQKLPLAINMRLRFRVHLFLSRFISRGVSKNLAKEKYDVVFCAYSFFCLSHLKLPYPALTVFTSDATYTAYKFSDVGAAFGSFLSVSRWLDPLILKAEKRVYGETKVLLWPSQWIKDAADDLYALDDDKSHKIHWGANIVPPDREDTKLDLGIGETVQLLLVGRDWIHKGGPLVFEILKKLIERGINAHLTVVGCVPPDYHTNEHMTVHAQLDKTDPAQLETFTHLYKTSHFFVMPSYEAYGFAFCEAGAYGLPALCLKVGGVPITEGVNGHALPKEAGVEEFCEQITSYINDEERYKSLRHSTRDYYEEHLHWDAWGQKVAKLIDKKRNPK